MVGEFWHCSKQNTDLGYMLNKPDAITRFEVFPFEDDEVRVVVTNVGYANGDLPTEGRQHGSKLVSGIQALFELLNLSGQALVQDVGVTERRAPRSLLVSKNVHGLSERVVTSMSRRSLWIHWFVLSFRDCADGVPEVGLQVKL